MTNFDGNNLLNDIDLSGHQTVSRVGRHTTTYDSTIFNNHEIFSMSNIQLVFMPTGIVFVENEFGELTYKGSTYTVNITETTVSDHQTVSRVGRHTTTYNSTIIDDNEYFTMLNIPLIFYVTGIVQTEDVFGYRLSRVNEYNTNLLAGLRGDSDEITINRIGQILLAPNIIIQ